jgi:hypothetical protein|tara:strand:+ start:49 stop:438 length:390 start_codon:yes stop_codon:yes gene_type:complete
MDQSHILKTFNDHFIEFIEDIIKVFPENSDLVSIKNSFISFRKLNPKLVLGVFRTYVIDKYSGEIDSKNIDFFINKNYESDLQDNSSSSMIIEKIDKLRDPVREMSEDNQQKVLKYLQNLKKLCLLYNQ